MVELLSFYLNTAKFSFSKHSGSKVLFIAKKMKEAPFITSNCSTWSYYLITPNHWNIVDMSYLTCAEIFSRSSLLMVYILPDFVVGVVNMHITCSKGTQHVSSLFGHKNEVLGPWGCMKFTFNSLLSLSTSMTMPIHQKLSYRQETYPITLQWLMLTGCSLILNECSPVKLESILVRLYSSLSTSGIQK